MSGKHWRFACIAVLASLGLGLQAGTAHAYLDPGTGSMLLQVLLGGVAGAIVALRLYWGRVKSFFRGHRAEPSADQDPAS